MNKLISLALSLALLLSAGCDPGVSSKTAKSKDEQCLYVNCMFNADGVKFLCVDSTLAGPQAGRARFKRADGTPAGEEFEQVPVEDTIYFEVPDDAVTADIVVGNNKKRQRSFGVDVNDP